MGENLLMVLLIVLLAGFAVGVFAYKPMNYKMIREKGYDADKDGKFIGSLAVIAVFIGVVAQQAVGERVALMGVIGVVALLVVILMVKRIKAVGVGNALLITLLQVLSLGWVILRGIFQISARMIGGSAKNAASQGEKVSKEAARKAELWREYEQNVAAIERGSTYVDEVTGMTDALLDEAKTDYEKAASKVGQDK